MNEEKSKVILEFRRAFELMIASLIGAFFGLYINTLATTGNMYNQVAWFWIIVFIVLMVFLLVLLNMSHYYLDKYFKKKKK
jgi:TRAP-type uncharacterized transport system fused permease subunit